MDAREGEEHVLLPLLQCDVPYDVQRSCMRLFQEAPPAPLSGCLSPEDPAARAILPSWLVQSAITHRGALLGGLRTQNRSALEEHPDEL